MSKGTAEQRVPHVDRDALVDAHACTGWFFWAKCLHLQIEASKITMTDTPASQACWTSSRHPMSDDWHSDTSACALQSATSRPLAWVAHTPQPTDTQHGGHGGHMPLTNFNLVRMLEQAAHKYPWPEVSMPLTYNNEAGEADIGSRNRMTWGSAIRRLETMLPPTLPHTPRKPMKHAWWVCQWVAHTRWPTGPGTLNCRSPPPSHKMLWPAMRGNQC